MAVGGFFMIPLVFRHTFHMYNLFWPAIFIIAGILFISSRRKGWSGRVTKDLTSDDYIDYINIFSGGDRQIVSSNFRGEKSRPYSAGRNSISQKPSWLREETR